MNTSLRNLSRRSAALIVAIVGFVASLLALQNAPPWVTALTVLVSVAVVAIIFYPVMRPYIVQRDRFVWFINRTDATPDMQREMERHDTLVFIGISQVKLAHYLRPSMDKISRGQAGDWKYVSVYFAHDDYGRSWEGDQFRRNLRTARQEIAQMLCDRDCPMTNLRNVSFWQSGKPLGYGGSIFGNTVDDTPEFDVIYTVNYLPSTADTQEALTAKITRSGGQRKETRRRNLFDVYLNAFDAFKKSSVDIGDFSPSIWDWSGSEWHDYCEKFPGIDKSVGDLLSLADLRGGENVLDVGGGTGEPAKRILANLPSGRLTLLEGSPGMLGYAKRLLASDDSRVRFALCHLFDRPETELDIQDQHYDIIFCHQSIASLISKPENLAAFARWCRKYLARGGSVVLNAHNGVLNMEYPAAFKDWNDPFRTRLVERLNDHQVQLRSRSAVRFEQAQIEEAFIQNGFTPDGNTICMTDISMNDRALMWRVPAIMDSLVDVRQLGIPAAQKIIEEVRSDVRHQDTMPRKIMSWKFTLPK